MNKATAAILFSLILLPVNLCCVFWMFREALYLSGFTVKQFLASAPYFFGTRRHVRRQRRRFLADFFRRNSADPQASLGLLRRFMLSTLPGLAALILAQWAALSPRHAAIVLLCDLILAGVNICLFGMGRAYRRSHPLDEELAQTLAQERSASHRGRNILVYTLVGAVFFGFLAFFHLSLASANARGKAITVKYDPRCPGDATHYLEPEPGFAWGGLIGFAVFGLIGLKIIRSALPAKKPRSSGHRK